MGSPPPCGWPTGETCRSNTILQLLHRLFLLFICKCPGRATTTMARAEQVDLHERERLSGAAQVDFDFGLVIDRNCRLHAVAVTAVVAPAPAEVEAAGDRRAGHQPSGDEENEGRAELRR